MNHIQAPNDENYQAEPPMGGCSEPQPSRELITEFLERHVEAYSGGGDYGDDEEANISPLDLDDEERWGRQRYSRGFADGFDYGRETLSIRSILHRRWHSAFARWRYALRMKVYAVKNRLFPPGEDDIPF